MIYKCSLILKDVFFYLGYSLNVELTTFFYETYRRLTHVPLKEVPTHAFKELINITIM